MKPTPLSISDEMQPLAQELQSHFSRSQLEALVKKTGFIRRIRKLTARDFVSLCAFFNEDLSTKSLTLWSVEKKMSVDSMEERSVSLLS